MYRKLKRVWSHNDMNYIKGFKETFPELKNVSSEDLCDRWVKLKIDFYMEIQKPVKLWIRLTLPFAFLAFILMLVGLPFCFLITGKWYYPETKKMIVRNWFRALKIQ